MTAQVTGSHVYAMKKLKYLRNSGFKVEYGNYRLGLTISDTWHIEQRHLLQPWITFTVISPIVNLLKCYFSYTCVQQ